MTWHSTPFLLPLLLICGLSAFTATIAWRRLLHRGVPSISLLAGAVAIWSLCYALELSGADVATSLVWAKCGYLGIVAAPVAWLALAIQYTRRESWLTRRRCALALIIPAITLLLVATNEYHRLIWRTTYRAPGTAGSYLAVTHGAWFWVHTAYSYACLLFGTVLFIQVLLRSRSLYRQQASLMLVGVGAPWIANVVYIAGITPWPELDLTPFGFTLTSTVLMLSMLRFRLLDLVPIARDTLFDRMTDGVVVLDALDRVVDLNATAQRVLGRPASVLGRMADDVFARWPNLLARYGDLAEFTEEITIDHGERELTVDIRVSPLRDRRGRLTGRLIVWRDMTGPARLAAALRASEAKLRILFSILPVGVAIVNDEREIVEMNPALEQLLDIGSIDLRDATYARREFVGADGRRLDANAIPSAQAIAAQQVVKDVPIGIVTGPERVIWTSVSAAPIPPPERGAVVVTTNVSAYVEASEALRHTNDALEARLTELLALNQLTQMVVAQVDLPAILATVAEQITLLLDATGTLVILLDNADRMLTFVADYDRDPAARSFVGTRIAFDAIPFAEHLIQTQRAMIISQPYINDLLRLFDAAPRTERYQAFMVVPLSMGGSTHGAIIVTGDQRARHFDDSAMRLAETVAGQVAGAIEQGKLLEAATRARSAAEAASQAKSHFLAAMSHELRTPLNVVLGYTQLLQRDETAALPQREALQIIRQSGEHLLMLIGDLIDLSKIEAGKIELTKGIVHLPALLEESAAMARLWAQHKGLGFVFERHPSDAAHACNVLLDERRLRQVLLNLLGNAVKFTDQGRVTLAVICAPDPLDAGRIQVRFAVEDTGIGIDQADQSAIFTPFTQAGPPDRRAQGAGLGLAIATELLQAMGSTLQVRSAPGAGSCFWFELMLELADAPQPRAPAARHVLGASRRVLVVDATAASRTLLRDLLVPLGFVVLEAASAGDALAIAQQQPLDILVVDTAIADVPLAVLIPSLRRSMPPNGKVIAVSAHLSDAPDQSDARIANTRFLLKPLVLDALLEAIEEPEPTIELAAPQRAAAIVRPPLEERNAMLSLAQLGDIRALRRHASELAQRDSSYGPFVQTLDQLAATLQLDAVQTLLRSEQWASHER